MTRSLHVPGEASEALRVVQAALTESVVVATLDGDAHVGRRRRGALGSNAARDLAEATGQLGIPEARVMGVSQGGMIAQWLAIDAPERVGRLALAVSLATQNETVQSVIGHWIRLAEADRFGDLAVDTMLKTYTEKGLRRWHG